MTITLNPETEALIQKRLESGEFENVEEVIRQALLDSQADEQQYCKEVSEKIDLAIAECERGECLTPSQARVWMGERKAAWRQGGRGEPNAR
jgi:Arc/MetJ-type ribon-helix-helix transcriptional regulator